MTPRPDKLNSPAIADHSRRWRQCRYVYPVISRRAGGVSLGVNLNPDKACNFGCLYCQVDRRERPESRRPDIADLREELRLALAAVASGELWEEPRFSAVPETLRGLHDIAISGDGEPTCVAGFALAVQAAADARAEAALPGLKLIVITNASRLDSSSSRTAIDILKANNGEIWAKLDAGSEVLFRRINRPRGGITLQRILDNITLAGCLHPVVIQSLLLSLSPQSPSPADLLDYTAALRGILDKGAAIRLIQLYTLARRPAERLALPLSDRQLDAAAEVVRGAVPEVPVETFYGLG